jgi:hypothetical protein
MGEHELVLGMIRHVLDQIAASRLKSKGVPGSH